MESDLEQQQQAPQVNSSGLTRYRSAPSSYFNNIIDREFYEHVFNRPSSPETERVFSHFMNSLGSEEDSPLAQKVKEEEEVINNNEHEHVVLQHQQQSNINNNDNYNSAPTHQQQQPHGFYQKPPLPNNGGNQNHSSNLIRHSSSPAGLFSQINIQNGMSHVLLSTLYFLFVPFFGKGVQSTLSGMFNFKNNNFSGNMLFLNCSVRNSCDFMLLYYYSIFFL